MPQKSLDQNFIKIFPSGFYCHFEFSCTEFLAVYAAQRHSQRTLSFSPYIRHSSKIVLYNSASGHPLSPERRGYALVEGSAGSR